MSRDEIQKLLGGYATNTLMPDEQQALFAAALEDQELFDALGREQSLRDLLSDGAARGRLLAVLDAPAPASWLHRWWKPLSAAALAVALASVAIVVIRHQPAGTPVMVARMETPPALPVSPPTEPAAAPAPSPAIEKPSIPKAEARIARQKEGAPADELKTAAASPPPPPPAPAPQGVVGGVIGGTEPPKEVAKKGTMEFAIPGAFAPVQAQASAGLVRPTATQPPENARNLPAVTRGAVANGMFATDAKTTATPPDARALFSGAVPAGAAGRGGRGGGGGAGIAAGFRALPEPPAANHLGIQYRVLRKNDSGEFVEADTAATGALTAGTNFKLRITANGGGYVRVLQETADGTWRTILNHAVEGMQAFDTEPIQVDQPGRVKFYLTFARQPLPESTVPQPDDDIVVDRGPVVTVAGRVAGLPQLSFNIMLTIQ